MNIALRHRPARPNDVDPQLAALGGVVAIYQWGWMGDFFGLAMDYMLFVTTGMREAYVHGASARTAVILGVRAGRAVVIAAAIIMISVFGAFVLSESAFIRPIGFALAFGVLVDAFIVRLLLMPALMSLAGDWAWWLPLAGPPPAQCGRRGRRARTPAPTRGGRPSGDGPG